MLERIFGADVASPWLQLSDFLHRVGVATAFSDYGVAPAEARGIIEFALEGARGKNFVNPAPRLDETIA